MDAPSHSGFWVSLCDRRITSIECHESSVIFHFADGFTVVDNDKVTTSKIGKVELVGCSSDDFSCYIIKRKTSRAGTLSRGKPISLEKLGQILSQKEKSIEIYLELYDMCFFHWRGEYAPYQKKRFRHRSDCIVIEAMDFFPMTYNWE